MPNLGYFCTFSPFLFVQICTNLALMTTDLKVGRRVPAGSYSSTPPDCRPVGSNMKQRIVSVLRKWLIRRGPGTTDLEQWQ
jgi:hypothetical protein